MTTETNVKTNPALRIEGRGPWFNLFRGATFIQAFDDRARAETALRRLARVG